MHVLRNTNLVKTMILYSIKYMYSKQIKLVSYKDTE